MAFIRGWFIAAIAILLLSVSVSSDAQDTDEKVILRLKWLAVKVGEVSREIRETSLNIKGSLRINGKVARKIDQRRALNADKQVKVLALDKGTIQKIAVVYKTQVLETQQGATPAEKDKRLAGKSFQVSQRDNVFAVLDSKGQAADGESAELVEGEEAHLFSKSYGAYARAVANKAWQFGETLKLDKEDAASLLGDKKQLKLDKVSAKLTLRRSRIINKINCLVFDTELTGSSEEYGTKTTLTLKGEITLEVNTCKLRLLILKGPINVLGKQSNQGQDIVFSSAGTMSVYQKID
jgi:hypothetical protein